uniref:Putative g-protein coupled receptor mth-like 1 isoform x2 n=1 Tax=Lutzomyia longipalpis TaxID=7200 RepID=A0A7G3AVA5_LUTLO
MHLLGLVVLTLATVSVAGGKGPPPPVNIRKCCRLGEHLEKTQKCAAGASLKWVPRVWLIARNQLHQPVGEAPRHFRILENTQPDTCQEPEFIYGENKFVIFSNGSLFLDDRNLVVPTETYCVERDSALVCLPAHYRTFHHNQPYLAHPPVVARKCCGPSGAWSQLNSTCVFLDNRTLLQNFPFANSTHVELRYGFPECKNNDIAIADHFRLENFMEETGMLILESGKQFHSTGFCLEHTLDEINTYVSVFTCSEHFSHPKTAPVPNNDIRFPLYAAGLFISVVFLLATLLASFLVPSNHHVLHWRCQTHYVACLLVGDLLLAITQISGNSIIGPACTIIAISMHFFFLAAFFWLNTMCFNIWWTFRDFRPTTLERSQELCRLRLYEVYAWGVPLLFSGVAAILDNLPDSTDDAFLRPRFGEKKCWFYGDVEMLTYFYGPIGVLLFVNIILFASTARQLTCGLWKRDDVKSTTERAALGRVCLKLVVVMGVTWIADVISWAVGGPNYLWYVTDFINALQGVFIFIVVGCQPQVWAAVKRICGTKSNRSVMNTTNGPQHSSSSHGLPSMGDTVTNNTFTNNTSTTNKVPMETVC